MPYLVAAVALVGIVSVLNLVLMYGVIRRLRVHSELMADARLPAGTGVTGLVPGSVVPQVMATALDGAAFDAAERPALVGFFSTSCATCREQVTAFSTYAQNRRSTGGEDAWAVVIGAPDTVDDLVAGLLPAAHVIVTDDADGELSRAFEVKGVPAFFEVAAGGRVRAVGVRVDDLSVAV